MAVTGDGQHWYLVNASPDFSVQVQSFPDLAPESQPPRNTRISGVFLTNADLDHLLGLFSLREGSELDIYATRSVRELAEESLGMQTVLNSFCATRWHEPVSGAEQPLGLKYRAIELGSRPPRFAGVTHSKEPGQSVAYEFTDSQQTRLVVAPDVDALNPGLLEVLNTADIVLFDGTFWSAEELQLVKPGAPGASEMGHMTIRDGSLKLLQSLRAKAKVYIHINNTNPILARDSAERRAVEAAGIVVGQDGLEFEL